MKKTTKNASQSWHWVALEQVLFTSSGGTPKTTNRSFWENGSIPWINSGALKDDVVSVPTTYITEEGLNNSSAKIFPKNTVAIALTGATLGRVGILDFACSGSQNVTGIFPSEYLNPKLLFYYFRFIREQLITKAVGAAQPHINKQIVDNTIIPVPPIEHQTHILTQLDKIHDKLSALEQKSIEINTLEDNAFKNLLYANGKLFPQVKLRQFCEQRTTRIGKDWKGKRLIGVSKEEGITDLRTSRKKTFDNYKIVLPGDFIYNPMRVNIGSISIYEGNEIALTSPDYVVFKVNAQLSKRLLLKFLKSDLGLREINNNTRGSVRSRLYFELLENISIPYGGIRVQTKADEILDSFGRMRAEATKVLLSTEQVVKSSYARFFDESNFSAIRTGSQQNLITLMSRERIVYRLANTGRKYTAMKKANISDENDLSNLIAKHFSTNRFTFDQLHSVSNMEYEALKELVFVLIDRQDITLEFDDQVEKMFLKAKAK